jgi:hypothetical protein
VLEPFEVDVGAGPAALVTIDLRNPLSERLHRRDDSTALLNLVRDNANDVEGKPLTRG